MLAPTAGPAGRRHSVAEQGAAGGGGGAAAAAGSNVAHHNGVSRSAIIMTSAQARRVSIAPPAPSTISRHALYENTYKTEPERAFSPAAAKRVLRETMESVLADKKYNTEECTQLSKTLADVIKQRVKELGYARYKLVTMVAIGQRRDSGVAFSSRCVWNAQFDSFAEHTYKNRSLYAVGLVYAVYAE